MARYTAVLTLSGVAQPNCVAIYLKETNFEDGFSVVIEFEGKKERTNFALLLYDESLSYIDARLCAQHRTLELTVRAHAQDVADDATRRILDALARSSPNPLQGSSASLALHIASRYQIDKSMSPSLFSGDIRRKKPVPSNGNPLFSIRPLSGSGAGKDGLFEKLQFTMTWQEYPNQILHLFDQDFQTVVTNSNRERLVSLSPEDFPELPEEVCQRAGLVSLSPGESTIVGQSDYELEPAPTFKDLLLRALTAGGDETSGAETARSLIENGTSEIDQEILCREISETFELQYKVWNNDPPIFGADEDKLNLLISGPTGSGKTALIDILVLRTIIVHQCMCIYLAPTRALTYEFFGKFVKRYGNFLAKVQGAQFKLEDEVVCSTGEQGEFDGSIRACNVSLACMVNEKANVLLAAEENKLIGKNSRLGLVVIDELHMMEDPQRGGVLDLLLSKLLYFQSNQLKTNRSLRITGITTEATVSRLVRLHAFDIDIHEDQLPPLELSTTRRPIPVTHKAVLKVRSKYWQQKTIPEVTLCNFKDTKDRDLDSATVRNSAHELAKIAGKIAPDLQNAYDNGHDKFYTAITDIVAAKLKSHRLVLVAMPTADLLEPAREVKNAIKNAIKTNSPDPETLMAFESDVATADLDSNARESIIELARHCVFIHSSEQPPELRRFVEKTFSKEVPGDWKAVIFTTETLSFGVNLAADCVVIGQIDFPRTIDGQEGVESLPLRPNAFHNLLGRAGRYGVGEKNADPAEAILLLNAGVRIANKWRATVENDYLDQIKSYYTTSTDEEQFSALFRPEIYCEGRRIGLSDLKTAQKRQRDAQKFSRNKQKDADEDYSYASLRSCCDILRFLASQGKSASSSEVVRFIVDYSVFGALELAGKTDPDSADWQKAKIKRDNLQYAVEELLEALARDEIRLLQRQENNTFHVTDRVSALIDTGVRPSAIKPIRTVLELLAADGGGNPKARVNLLLIAFCATPEFWDGAAREFCEDACGAYDEESAGQYVDYTVELFLSEIGKLGPELDSDFALRVADVVFKAANDLEYLYLDPQKSRRAGTDVKRAVFFKLCTVTLRWLRGAPYDEITSLFPKAARAVDVGQTSGQRSKGTPSGFASKYSEKLGWLADATHKYFGDEAALMPAQLKVEIKLLGERCRRGLPGHLIPFAESYHDRDGVTHPTRTRTQSIALIDTEQPGFCDYSACNENGMRARSYFARSFRDNLAATLELKNDCPEFFASIQNRIKENEYEPEEFMSGLQKNFGPHVDQFSVNYYPESGVIWIINGFRIDLLLPGVTPQDTNGQRVVFRLVGFWGELNSHNGVRISVFGAIVLAAMIKRELLSYQKLFQRDRSGFLSVAEIVSELADPDIIKRLGSFEEQLLAFREPLPL